MLYTHKILILYLFVCFTCLFKEISKRKKHNIKISNNFSSKTLESIKQMYYYIGVKTFDRCGLYLLQIKEGEKMNREYPNGFRILSKKICTRSHYEEDLTTLLSLIKKSVDNRDQSVKEVDLLRCQILTLFNQSSVQKSII